MPDVDPCLVEDAGDQEEFDYAPDEKNEDDEEMMEQAQADANQEPIQSDESSAIRSVQVPHRDEPDDDDGEFINDEKNEFGAMR